MPYVQTSKCGERLEGQTKQRSEMTIRTNDGDQMEDSRMKDITLLPHKLAIEATASREETERKRKRKMRRRRGEEREGAWKGKHSPQPGQDPGVIVIPTGAPRIDAPQVTPSASPKRKGTWSEAQAPTGRPGRITAAIDACPLAGQPHRPRV